MGQTQRDLRARLEEAGETLRRRRADAAGDADAANVGDEADAARFLVAVDRAQNFALACGLVRAIGQDAVQAIMPQSFRRCRIHQHPSAEPPPQYEAPETTIEALKPTAARGADGTAHSALDFGCGYFAPTEPRRRKAPQSRRRIPSSDASISIVGSKWIDSISASDGYAGSKFTTTSA